MIALSLHNVCKNYREIPVLNAVNLYVPAGEIVGLSGPSGSGKSTLLRIAAGIEQPDFGQVLRDGKLVWAQQGNMSVRPCYAMPIFQNPVSSLDPGWPIWRSLTEPLWRESLPRKDRLLITSEWLAKAELSDLDPGSLPGELSGGQCQRIAVLRAIIAKPSLIIADEPTSALDSATNLVVRRLLRDAAKRGTSILLASHNMRDLISICDRTLRLANGTLSDMKARELRDGQHTLPDILAILKSRKAKPRVNHVSAINAP